MRLESTRLPVNTTPGSGASQSVRNFREKYVQIGGSFTATFRIEVSLDGQQYFRSGADISAPGIYAVPEPAMYLRVTTVAFTSGTVNAVMNAYNGAS